MLGIDELWHRDGLITKHKLSEEVFWPEDFQTPTGDGTIPSKTTQNSSLALFMVSDRYPISKAAGAPSKKNAAEMTPPRYLSR